MMMINLTVIPPIRINKPLYHWWESRRELTTLKATRCMILKNGKPSVDLHLQCTFAHEQCCSW